MARHILPQADGEGTLGSPSRRWNNIYVDTLQFGDGSQLTSAPSLGSGIFISSYDSGNLSFTMNNDTTLTHNLGKVPFLIKWHLVCVSAEYGFSVGDKFWPGQQTIDNYDNSHQVTMFQMFISSFVDEENQFDWILGTSSSGIRCCVANGGAEVFLTTSKWRIRFFVYAKSTDFDFTVP